MLRKYKYEKGITGLETAIILIAFVVVAAVFAYTVLSAGMFSSQKSSEAVYDGLDEARSTIELNGSVIAKDTNDDDEVDQIIFTVTNALGGEPVDFTPTSGSANRVVITYIDKDQKLNDVQWTLQTLGYSDSDNLMENDEKFQVTVIGLDDGGANELTPKLGAGKQFSVQVTPPQGAVLILERTTPENIDAVMNLN